MQYYIIPTLTVAEYISSKNISAQLAYIMKIYLTAPTQVNTTIASSDMISLTERLATFDASPDKLKELIELDLKSVTARLYNDTMTATVDVTLDTTDYGDYDITVDWKVTDSNGEIYGINQRFDIKDSKVVLNLDNLN